jgi:hypothetical protein
VLFGTWAEFILPALVVLGLFTRLAALGMIGFVLVLTWVDIMGHGAGPETIGAWFNNTSGDAILDQRAFWIFLLIVLVLRGAGPALARRAARALQERRSSPSRPSRGEARHAPSRSPAASSPRDARPTDRGRQRALGLRQPAPGGGAGVHQPIPEGREKPRPRGLVQRRLPHIHQHRVMTRLRQRPNRLPAGIAVAQSVDLHGLATALPPFSMICAN